MALAIQIPEHYPEVLALMDTPLCRRHRIRMIEIAGADGCFKCPIKDCDSTYDTPPSTPNSPPPPARRDACVRPLTPFPKGVTVGQAFGFDAGYVVPQDRWATHVHLLHEKLKTLKGIPPVPQSNSSADYSIMNGPPAPGGGGSKSGRRRKKTKGGKKFTDGPWGAEGGTGAK